jgi:hypothetical protein
MGRCEQGDVLVLIRPRAGSDDGSLRTDHGAADTVPDNKHRLNSPGYTGCGKLTSFLEK